MLVGTSATALGKVEAICGELNEPFSIGEDRNLFFLWTGLHDLDPLPIGITKLFERGVDFG